VSRRSTIVCCALIVAVPLLGYPLALVATGGLPRFPTRAAACAPAPVGGQKVDVVFGRFDSLAPALPLRDRVLGFGFQGTEAVPDGCGRIVVRIHGVESIEVGKEIQAEAATVGFHPSLELSR
jgi:hypothetical protein